MIKTNTTTPQPCGFGPSQGDQNAMYDLINDALATGAYASLPEYLMRAARTNPHMDWNAPLRNVLTQRVLSVGNRRYATRLVAIPLHGSLGAAFDQTYSVSEILNQAVKEQILSRDDGLAFLDTILPRRSIQMLTHEDVYNLIPRLFDRAVRGIPEPVLDAKVDEVEQGAVDSGMMVGVLYWRIDKPLPKLLSDHGAMKRLGELVAQQIMFQRASPFNPMPIVRSQPLGTFLDATHASTQDIAKRHIERFLELQPSAAVAVTLNVIGNDGHWGEYQIEATLTLSVGEPGSVLTLVLDDLRDGSIPAMLEFLIAEFRKRGVTKAFVGYQQYVAQTVIGSNQEAVEVVRAVVTRH